MDAQRLFSEALELVDTGSRRQGEATLRRAIAAAERERDELLLGSALCRLGELLMQQERAREARPFLKRVVEIKREDSALYFEVDRAMELLGEPLVAH